MRIIIIANYKDQQNLKHFLKSHSNTAHKYVLVDGGCNAILALPRKQILFACGDFDHFSLASENLLGIKVYKKLNQYETDLEFSLRLITKKKIAYEEIAIFVEGPRSDMYLQIIALMLQGYRLRLYYQGNMIKLLTKDFRLKCGSSQLFSLINLQNYPAKITIINAKYEVNNQ